MIVGGRIVAEGTPATIGGRSSAKATVTWLSQDGTHTLLTDTPTALIAEPEGPSFISRTVAHRRVDRRCS